MNLTDDELLILINTLHSSLPGTWSKDRMDKISAHEREVLMLKLSENRTTQIVERNRAKYNMAQVLARDDR